MRALHVEGNQNIDEPSPRCVREGVLLDKVDGRADLRCLEPAPSKARWRSSMFSLIVAP